MPGGSVEHVNPEPGQVWLERALARVAAHGLDQSDARESQWTYSQSTRHDRRHFSATACFALTPDGLEGAMRALRRA